MIYHSFLDMVSICFSFSISVSLSLHLFLSFLSLLSLCLFYISLSFPTIVICPYVSLQISLSLLFIYILSAHYRLLSCHNSLQPVLCCWPIVFHIYLHQQTSLHPVFAVTHPFSRGTISHAQLLLKLSLSARSNQLTWRGVNRQTICVVIHLHQQHKQQDAVRGVWDSQHELLMIQIIQRGITST